MTLLTLFAYGALGGALAWLGIAWLQRTRQRHQPLHCITPYRPADQRSTPQGPRP